MNENDEPVEIPSEDNETLLLSMLVEEILPGLVLAGGIWYMLSTIPKITREKWMRQMLYQQGK
uniref:Uncharacterized protein n=1 Tax=Panthera tigris altaica TaxID=74533 RepID=A0A8C9JUD4_PANTA